MKLAQHIGEQARRVDRRPTAGQKLAGNYRKGHIRVHGLDITIENPKGSWRSGTSLDGKTWRARLPYHYGYIKRTTGADGDHVDVFVGPHLASPHVFVIDQHHLHVDKPFDEHKVFIGFGSERQACHAYAAAFSDGKGRRRIGHVAHLSVDQFKDWLQRGNTLHPIAGRAAGGRVGYADGGAPPFEATSDVPSFDETQEMPPDAGKMDAALRGARAGATFNFGDEIAGARANAPTVMGAKIPDLVGPIPARTLAGVARTGYGYLTGNKDMTSGYEAARDEERKADESAKINHPYVYAGSELAGAVPSMAALPEAGAAKALAPAARGIARFGARSLDAAVAGGQYGALAGAGEGKDTADRAVSAATGLVSGILGGAAGHAVGEGLGWLGSRYVGPALQTVRGWMDPNGEASRRLAAALRSDQEMIANGTAQGMTPQQWAAARANGEPVTLADLGAGRTQALLRSAANTSPEGRAQLENMLEQRFHQQGPRVAETVRNAIPGGRSNATKTGDQLVAEYDAGRVPAYQRAYQEGDKEIMTPAMERLMGSPMVVQAMQRAVTSGQDRAITMGMGAFRPGVVVENGVIKFQPKPNGVPAYPNLQYWDAVKRELDDVAVSAGRSGEKGKAEVAGNLARVLRGELDSQVPSYANARGIAERYFGESNALQAGQKLAGKKMDPDQVEAILRKMRPDERALFQEGYASDLANRVIGSMGDTTNITKGRGILSSPNERRMATAIFGPGGAAQLEARMHLERIMDGARQAMGNSTTARQLIEAGLAGGAGAILGGASSGWDPVRTIEGFGAGAGARLGSHLLKDEIKVGAKHLIGKVDARTARRVAELLTSDDPRQLQAGYQMAARSEAIMSRLRAMGNRMALITSTTARQPVTSGVRMLQGPSAAAAGQDQQQP